MKNKKRRFEILEELEEFEELGNAGLFDELSRRKSKSRRNTPASDSRHRGISGGQYVSDTSLSPNAKKNGGSSAAKKSSSAKKNFSGSHSRARNMKSRSAEDNNTLAGKCLVYIGSGKNELYKESVIYITDCSPESVKGIVINKLLFGSAVVECQNREDSNEQSLRSMYEDLYQGGPVNPANGFVLFPSNGCFYEDPYARVLGEIAISSSFGVLQDILDGDGPDKKIIAMGHCVWKRGELEWEIFNNEWLIVPGDPKLIFDTRFEDRWEQAKLSSGINLGGYIPHIGLA